MTDLAKGISLYPGLEHSLEENLEQLRTAAEMGISRLFLSYHIPETDPAALGKRCSPCSGLPVHGIWKRWGTWCRGIRCRKS